MAEAKLKLRRHRTVIVLICLALLVLLMQGASYFSLGHQLARSQQVEQLTQTLARQVAFSLAPLMDSQNDGADIAQITTILNQLTDQSRILDASVYQLDGSLIAHSGETVPVRDRLALDGKRAGSYFNHQIVQPIGDKDGPSGFLRMTLDTHVLATEAKQVDNTTNLLRLMMLLALAIGIILARTLLQGRRSRWEQSPFLLTASTRLKERDEDDDLPAHNNEPLVIAIAEEHVEDKPALTPEEEAELEAVQAAYRNLQLSREQTEEEEKIKDKDKG